MLIDVHVHSKYSKRPSQWILKKIGCPECFTEPIDIYQIAKSRGMTHVTIADHNTINGAQICPTALLRSGFFKNLGYVQ